MDSLNQDSKLIEKVEIAGPGFINFYLSQNWVYDILPVVEAQDTAYGSVDLGHGEKVQIEFVSANQPACCTWATLAAAHWAILWPIC